MTYATNNNSKEFSALSVATTAAASSSSSSAAAAAEPANNKRKYSTLEETEAHKKIKNEFDSTLANVADMWKKEKSSEKVNFFSTITLLSKSPLDIYQRELVNQLLETKPSEEDSVKQDSEILSKANESLYTQLKNIKGEAERYTASLRLLNKAIQHCQKEIVERVIADLDLTQDNPLTFICLRLAAISTPEIAQLILSKNPRTTFLCQDDNMLCKEFNISFYYQDTPFRLHQEFFGLAFVNRDINFFKYLLSKNDLKFFESRAHNEITVSPDLLEFLNLFITDPRLEPSFDDLLRTFSSDKKYIHYFKAIFKQAAFTNFFINFFLTEELSLNNLDNLSLRKYISSRHWLIQHFVKSIQENNESMIEIMMENKALCQQPIILWTAVQSGNDKLANKLIREKGASPTVTLSKFAMSHLHDLSKEAIHTAWSTIWSRLNPHLATISKLISLGANIDKSGMFFKILGSWIPDDGDYPPVYTQRPNLKDYSTDDIFSMIEWFVGQGASLYNPTYENNSPIVMIVLLDNPILLSKTLLLLKGLTHSDYSKLINIAFRYSLRACSKEVCEILEKASVVSNHSYIDFQEHLIDMITNFDITHVNDPLYCASAPLFKELNDKIDFLISKGARPFIGKKNELPPLLKCCLNGHWAFLEILREKDGYNKHLLDSDKDGFGIFTHISRFFLHNDAIGAAPHVKKIFEQLCIDFSRIAHRINMKDILGAYIILKERSTGENLKENDFDSILAFLPREVPINYYTLAFLRKLLVDGFNVPFSNMIFNTFMESFEDFFFQQVPDHFKKDLTTYELSPGQLKEISAIDCHAWLKSMLDATLTDNKKAFKIKMDQLIPTKEAFEKHQKAFEAKQKAYKTNLEKFFDVIQKRTHAIGVPTAVPSELNNKQVESSAFLTFEAETRRIIPNSFYILILANFIRHLAGEYQGSEEEQEYFVKLINSLKEIAKTTHVDILSHPLLTNFFKLLFDKECFFIDFEQRMSTIIYSYKFGKKNAILPIASASSSSSTAAALPLLSEYDRTDAGSLLSALHDASSSCATQWTTSLITLEDPAINIIQKYTNNTVVHTNELTALEKELYNVLSEQRKANIKLWAQKKIVAIIANINNKSDDSCLTDEQRRCFRPGAKREAASKAKEIEIDSIVGSEVHYFNAALQHCGKELGIPRCENIVEDPQYWHESCKKEIYDFINNANSPKALIDLIDDSINKHKSIKHEMVADWMKDHLIDDWEKDRYKSYETILISEVTQKLADLKVIYAELVKQHDSDVAKIRKNPEAKLRVELTEKSEKEFIGQLENQIFNPIWTYLTSKQFDPKNSDSRILFTPFEDTLRSLITKGELFEGASSPLFKIITNACIKARTDAFTYEIYDQKALSESEKFVINRHEIRLLLGKLKVIYPIQTTMAYFDAYRTALLGLNTQAQAVPVNQQQPQGQLHANPPPRPQIPLDQQQRFIPLAAEHERNAFQPVNRNQPDHLMGVPAPAPMPAAGPPVYNPYGNGHYDNKDEKG